MTVEPISRNLHAFIQGLQAGNSLLEAFEAVQQACSLTENDLAALFTQALHYKVLGQPDLSIHLCNTDSY